MEEGKKSKMSLAEQVFKLPFIKQRSAYKTVDERSKNIVAQLAKRRLAKRGTLAERCAAEKHGIEKRLEDSDKALTDLLGDGTELITNIRIANDKREVDRRNKEAELREELLEKLQKESIEASAKFSFITSQWTELDSLKDPMGIYEALELQKERINDLMMQKDVVIADCRRELDAADSRYILDQEKQSADIYCLVERIDKQIDIMKTAYQEHLELLQSSIDNERDIIRTKACRKWNEVYDQRAENEEMKLKKEKEKTEFYAIQMEKITIEHEEITRATRIRLEKDNQALQIELQNLKANVMLNSDKLDYNYQVLKKREDENVIIRNQQKRRIARLNDTVTHLRNKITETQKKCENETTKLTDEAMKLHKNIMDLEEKADAISEINDKKYHNVWQMNQDEGNELLEKVLAIDKVLYEQQLGLEWVKPTISLIDKHQLPSYKTANQIVNEYKQSISAYSLAPIIQSKEKKKEILKEKVDTRVLRMIIRKVANKSGFLIEKKVIDLLKPYTDDEKILVRIDNVFNALGIRRVEDVISLQKYFMPYTWCPNCSKGLSESIKLQSNLSGIVKDEINLNIDKSDDDDDDDDQSEEIINDDISRKTGVTFKDNADTDSQSIDSNLFSLFEEYKQEDILSESTGKSIVKKTEVATESIECTQHNLVIESGYILTALREYTENHLAVRSTMSVMTMKHRLSRVRSTVSRLIQPQDVKNFWERFCQIFTPQKERLWHALEHGLTLYLKILREREKQDSECENLRRQNKELKFLMQKYVPNTNCPC